MICPGVISIGIPRPGVTGLSSELEVREGGDGEHVGALEAMIGEATLEAAVVVIMRLLEDELLKFVELVLFGILVAVVGMTRVGFVEAVAVVVVVTVNNCNKNVKNKITYMHMKRHLL